MPTILQDIINSLRIAREEFPIWLESTKLQESIVIKPEDILPDKLVLDPKKEYILKNSYWLILLRHLSRTLRYLYPIKKILGQRISFRTGTNKLSYSFRWLELTGKQPFNVALTDVTQVKAGDVPGLIELAGLGKIEITITPSIGGGETYAVICRTAGDMCPADFDNPAGKQLRGTPATIRILEQAVKEAWILHPEEQQQIR